MNYADISLWHETCGDSLQPRPALSGPTDVDVAIVGAGFTGLWTAYYLKKADPSLRIAVLEREVAGFGASGRNGGWASALFPTSRATLARLPGSSRDEAKRLYVEMRATVDEMARVVEEEAIDCGFHKGGTISLARTACQLGRARAEVAEAREWGDTEDDIRLLSSVEAAEMLHATEVRGGVYTPHCARVHPARLARGIARTVERLGVDLYEQTPVESIRPGHVDTPQGRVRADVVVRATEGYTPALRGLERAVIPVYSLIVATEQLPQSVWDRVGLADRPTFTDYRHLLVYGQRSMDERLVFGGRGAPYHYNSTIEPQFDREPRVFASLREALVDLFPVLRGVRITHQWGGPLGIARDWVASVGFDRGSGLGWAGGYVGDGVSTTNLAGRTLADLVTGRTSDLTTLPWVGHRSPDWEREPLRWLGVNAGLRAMTFADQEERVTKRHSVIAKAMAPLVGGH